MLLNILIIVAVLIIALVLFYRFHFLRDPERKAPKGNNLISPSDGKVVRIVELKDKNALKIKKGLLGKIKTLTKDTIKEGYLISIMMTPLDVHYQRAPIDGTIISTKHTKGKLYNAVSDAENMKATLMNEKNEILINTKIGKIKVIQIAGFVARRIHCFVKKGQKIKKGQRIGIIKLGSQVSFIIPKLKVKVKVGEKVKAGETIIAEY